MSVIEISNVVQWASVLALLLAASLAIDLRLRTRDRAPLLLAAGLSLLVVGWLATSFYAAILRLVFGLVDPRNLFPWYAVGEALTWATELSIFIAYALLAAGVLALGHGYARR